ncbi:uncharacterized protein [Mytilus edulis]|uniref:uncharacterized protein n=1 Tax=Mytilus edulis TaxID=6550 RepID=UPI0039F0F202
MGKSFWRKFKCRKCCPNYNNWKKEKTQVASDDFGTDSDRETTEVGKVAENTSVFQETTDEAVSPIDDLNHDEEFVSKPVTELNSEEKNEPNLESSEEELKGERKEEIEGGRKEEIEGEREEEIEDKQRETTEDVVGTVWDSITRGSISQADISSEHANNQCTSIALTAAGTHEVKSISTWVSVDIDMVLYQGDENHGVYRSLFKISSENDDRISIDDLVLRGITPVFMPTTVAFAEILDIWRGMLFYPDNMNITELDKISIPLLSSVLAAHLTERSPMIVTIDEFSLAFIKEGGNIWLFDSHCRGDNGEKCVPLGTGKAFAVPFANIAQITEYIEREYGTSNAYQAASIQYTFPSDTSAGTQG